MIAAQVNPTEAVTFPPVAADADAHPGITFYRQLTGHDPAEADIGCDDDFDRHVLASIVAVSAMDGGAIAERTGLSEEELNGLLVRHFSSSGLRAFAWTTRPASQFDDEAAMVRDLLETKRSTEGKVGGWLAAMIARRAMEPNHLWEDLGLRDRSELTRLLMRHFAPLATRNTRNMRWKRFFYRMLCEDDGLVMCTTPVCTQCRDFDLCFGEEGGESRMAERRREAMRGGNGLADAVQR